MCCLFAVEYRGVHGLFGSPAALSFPIVTDGIQPCREESLGSVYCADSIRPKFYIFREALLTDVIDRCSVWTKSLQMEAPFH